MGAGNLVLAFATPENREVLAGTGLLFDDETSLAALLRRVVSGDAADASELDRMRAAARERAAATYSWDAVTTAYERLWESLGAGR